MGELAREYVPGGVLIEQRASQRARVQATETAIQAGKTTLYEASFTAGGVFVSVDILEQAGDGWRIIEVKASNSRKPGHDLDAAIQAWVVEQSGLMVESVAIMHLNPECRYPDLSNLFVREDVTDDIRALMSGIPAELSRQTRTLRETQPNVELGKHCFKPIDCPLLLECTPRRPKHYIYELYRLGKSDALQWEKGGEVTLHDINRERNLSAIRARQVRAVETGGMVVEPGLSEALEVFESPLAFLDFETISIPIPCWDGCGPWQQVAVQFSCHVERDEDEFEHYEYVADGPEDPRHELASSLVEACRGAKTVVAYNVSFERSRILELAATVPSLADDLIAISDRLADLLPVVRNNLYHPDFRGSFSIKRVVEVLLPELSYEDLAIADGQSAMSELEALLFTAGGLSLSERARRRRRILEYCRRDTETMVALTRWLRSRAFNSGRGRL